MTIQPAALTVQDAATYIGKSPDVVRGLINAGTLTARYLDARPVILVRDLDALLEAAPTERPGPKATRSRK